MKKKTTSIIFGVIAAIALSVLFLQNDESVVKDHQEGSAFVNITKEAGFNYEQAVFNDSGELECGDCGELDYLLREHSAGVTVGDYDGDGFDDIFVTRVDQTDLLFQNQGDGTFIDVSKQVGLTNIESSTGANWVDIDNDDDLDLIVATINEEHLTLYKNQYAILEKFEFLSEPHQAYGFAVGDFDQDKFIDVYTNEWGFPQGSSRLLRNLGDQGDQLFEDVTDGAGLDMPYLSEYIFESTFGDFDNDGFLDLYVASDFGTSRLFWNNGDGTFTDGTVESGVGEEENAMGIAVADYDNDGDFDIYVTSIFDGDVYTENQEVIERCFDKASEVCDPGATMEMGWTGNRLYRNDGNREFTDVTSEAGVRDGGWGWGAQFFDYDNDGDQDLLSTNGWVKDDRHEQMRFWVNNGDGTFTEKAEELGFDNPTYGRGVAVLDIENDGDLDVFIANQGGAPRLYRNELITNE